MAGTRYLLMEFAEWGNKSERAEHICDSMIAIAQTDWLPILAHAHCDEAYVDALVFGNADRLIAGEEVPL